MALFDFLRGKNQRSLDSGEPDDKFWQAIRPLLSRGTAGQNVNTTTAQRVAAVYACKTAICESIAMLPATIYDEVDERSKVKKSDHELWKLLREEPNPMMDSFEFHEAMQENLLDFGNAYAHILRSKSGAIKRLTPLLPELMTVKVLPSQTLGYEYSDSIRGPQEYTSKDIFHLKYRTRDGLVGRSPIASAAEAIAFPMALQEHGNSLFENGAFLSGFIKSPTFFKTDEGRKKFMDSFKKYMGARKTGKFGLLEGGTDFVPFTQKSRDAQFAELWQLAVLEIARIYRVPPVMIQVTESGMSYASIEQLAIIWVQYTIQPHQTRWERAIRRQLLRGEDEQTMFVRYNTAALIRGDLKSRTESIVQQIQYGLKTINEGRNLLDENSVEDSIADEILLSHNLIPASKALEVNTPLSKQVQDDPQDEQELDEEEEDQDEQSSEDRSQLFKPLFHDLLGRVARREQRAVSSAVKKPNFMKWAEEFAPAHRETIVSTLRTAIHAYTGKGELIEDFAEIYIRELQGCLLDQRALLDDDSVIKDWVGKLIKLNEKPVCPHLENAN